jgi:hypothetical protein
MDELEQPFPDYESSAGDISDYAQGTNILKKKSGKLSREGERRKKRKWRSNNKSKYNAYMRAYMARLRSGGLASGD